MQCKCFFLACFFFQELLLAFGGHAKPGVQCIGLGLHYAVQFRIQPAQYYSFSPASYTGPSVAACGSQSRIRRVSYRTAARVGNPFFILFHYHNIFTSNPLNNGKDIYCLRYKRRIPSPEEYRTDLWEDFGPRKQKAKIH